MLQAFFANSGSSFLLCLTFQTIMVIYIKYNIISGIFLSIILSIRYNHLSGKTIILFCCSGVSAKSYIDHGCVIHYHIVYI